MGDALRLTGVAKRFGATAALDGVDLQVREGEVHALVGENGAGKTTLMNVLAGAFPPDRGELEVAGRAYAPHSPADALARGVALIHQELSLFPHLTVEENLLAGRESTRGGWLDRPANRRRAREVLEAFGHPEITPERRVADLPLPARQVVEICRALEARARILLMDEPTSALPAEDARRLFALVRRLRDQGVAVVYISHFLEEVREVADRVTVLRDGRSVLSREMSAVGDEEVIAAMVGRPVTSLFPPRHEAPPGEIVLRVEGLSAPPGLLDASFELRGGEVLGIAGLVGSGRSEMLRALFGLDRKAAGAVRVRGRTLGAESEPSARVRRGLGYLSEDRKGEGLALALPVADNVTVTRLSACARRGWLVLSRQARAAAVWLERLRARWRSAFQPTWTLSGGNQQKVALARLLHQQAEVLLLDEPTRGVDIASKAEIYEAVARAAAEGRAVLLVSSYLPELFGLSHRLAVMSRGRLSAAWPVAEWTPESVLQAAIGGRADREPHST